METLIGQCSLVHIKCSTHTVRTATIWAVLRLGWGGGAGWTRRFQSSHDNYIKIPPAAAFWLSQQPGGIVPCYETSQTRWNQILPPPPRCCVPAQKVSWAKLHNCNYFCLAEAWPSHGAKTTPFRRAAQNPSETRRTPPRALPMPRPGFPLHLTRLHWGGGEPAGSRACFC